MYIQNNSTFGRSAVGDNVLISTTKLKSLVSGRSALAPSYVAGRLVHGLQLGKSYALPDLVPLCLGDQVPIQGA